MRFSFNLMGMELFSFEFALPSKGIYPVPDTIPSEFELMELELLDGDDED